MPVSATTQTNRARVHGAEERSRSLECVEIKKDAALTNARMPVPATLPNGDEQLYSNHIGAYSYHKGLRHNEIGEVDLRAYESMLRALGNGRPADFEDITLGGNVKLSNPQGGLAFDLEGCDPQQTFIATPPSLNSSWRGAEMVEDLHLLLPN